MIHKSRTNIRWMSFTFRQYESFWYHHTRQHWQLLFSRYDDLILVRFALYDAINVYVTLVVVSFSVSTLVVRPLFWNRRLGSASERHTASGNFFFFDDENDAMRIALARIIRIRQTMRAVIIEMAIVRETAQQIRPIVTLLIVVVVERSTACWSTACSAAASRSETSPGCIIPQHKFASRPIEARELRCIKKLWI